MMPLLLPSAPGRMSLTKTVPSTVPSLFHNSDPWVASEAEKKTVSPNAVRFSGLLPFELCVFQMSFTSSGDGAAPAYQTEKADEDGPNVQHLRSNNPLLRGLGMAPEASGAGA